jgi:hypothetical protein
MQDIFLRAHYSIVVVGNEIRWTDLYFLLLADKSWLKVRLVDLLRKKHYTIADKVGR